MDEAVPLVKDLIRFLERTGQKIESDRLCRRIKAMEELGLDADSDRVIAQAAVFAALDEMVEAARNHVNAFRHLSELSYTLPDIRDRYTRIVARWLQARESRRVLWVFRRPTGSLGSYEREVFEVGRQCSQLARSRGDES